MLNGLDVGLEQIKAGLAWHYKQFEQEQTINDRATYAEAERYARLNRIGLWQDSNPMPPWDFRQYQRKTADEMYDSNLTDYVVINEHLQDRLVHLHVIYV